MPILSSLHKTGNSPWLTPRGILGHLPTTQSSSKTAPAFLPSCRDGPNFKSMVPMSAHVFDVDSEHFFITCRIREHNQKIEERSHFSLEIDSIYLPEDILVSTAYKRVVHNCLISTCRIPWIPLLRDSLESWRNSLWSC